MTALDQFDRLEALGHWRLSDADPGREVLVSFGKSTLVLQSFDDAPLTHWSMPALRIVDRAAGKLVLSPDPSGTETLTTDDATLIEALTKVLGADRQNARRKRIRSGPVLVLLLLGGLVATYMQIPSLLSFAARHLIPPERQTFLADDLLDRIAERTGPACSNAAGQRALARFATALAGPEPAPRLHVADIGDAPFLALPQQTILLSRTLVESATTPTDLAAWVRTAQQDPAANGDVTGLFARDDLMDGLRFLSSGHVSDAARDRLTTAILLRPTPVLDASHNTAPLNLADETWVALQDICAD